MLGPPMLPPWVRSIARLWPGRARGDVADAKVTFIAGPPRELLRIWAQQVNGEPTSPPAHEPVNDNRQ
jgi:hypothetical protein